MKRTTLLLLWLLTICFSAIRSDALTIPASEDSWSYNGQNDKLTLSGNNANNLVVDAKRRAYLYFDLGDVPSSAVVRWAKLRLFLPVVQRAGNGLSVHSVTSEWNESKASNLPTVSTGTLGIITPDKMASRRFVTVDVTSTVQQWISGGTLNEGFAVQPIVKAGNQTASVVLTSKEGAVFGLPAELDIEFQPEGGVNKPVTLDQLPSEMRALLNPAPPTLTAESQLPQSVRNLLGSLSGAFTPKMTTQPDLSQGAQLFATAENSLDPLVRYQWLRNGVPILTGTESSLRRAGLAGGTYQVRASNTVSGTNSVSVVVPDNGHEVVFIPNTGVLFSKYETTVGQWKAFVEETGWSKSDAWRMPANEGQTDFIQDDFHPVIKVSWDDSTDYCQWLSRKTGKLFRLPSESEWMTAVPTEYPWGTSFPPSASKGNYAMDAEGRRDWPRGGIDGFKFTAPVGTFSPDHRGLFDISGNIWEWLKDNVVDGGASKKMFTGGSWNDVPSDSSSPSDVSSNRRGIESASFKNNNVGFRVVRDWLNEGLVAHYPFNGNATDDSGNGLNGRFHGSPSLGTDRFGGQSGYTYPNASDVVILPIDHSKFETDFTISVWVQPTARNHDYAQILSGENSFLQLHLYGPVYDSNGSGKFGQVVFYQHNKSLDRHYRTLFLNSQNQIGVGGWSHILVTVSGDQSRFYLNGVLKDSGSQSFEFAGVTGSALYLGGNLGNADAENFRWEGAIDDVRIYNRALSEQEVKILYSLEKPETISTYQFVQGNFTWDQAKADAESKGGHLGVITSQEEWTNIVGQLGANAGKYMWIGAFQESGASSVTSGWKWVTEEPFDYNAWGQGEPNGGATGFVHVNHPNAPYASGLWNDDWSGNPKDGYLLEIEINASDFVPTITAQPSTTGDLSVTALGANLQYQWSRNGVSVSGGTAAVLRRAGLSGGTYQVRVSNAVSGTNSVSVVIPDNGHEVVHVPNTNVMFSKYETTVGQWKAFVEETGWDKSNAWKNTEFAQADNEPVLASKNDALDYCAWLIAKTGEKWRLPTDSEWQVAAGTSTYPWGENYPPSGSDGNYSTANDPFSGTSPVGSFNANVHGLFDIGGNAFEWIADVDSLAGGSWTKREAFMIASSFRQYYPADMHSGDFGFRVVREIPELIKVSGGTLPASSSLGAVPVETFYIGRTEVTWKEWVTVRDWAVVNGYDDLAGVGEGVGDNYPVTHVNWYDVVKWCNARSEKEGKTPVYKNGTDVYRTGVVSDPQVGSAASGYRLPTEKEWEHAARGGTQTQGYTYSGSNDLSAVGWYYENSGSAVHEVGKKQANELGIYDMSGNLWEWSGSWYPGYEGSFRVIRGGGWYAYAGNCTVAIRYDYDPGNRYAYDGLCFRVALSSVPEMVLVTGGTLPASSSLGAVPVETFYIGRTEVTWKEWVTVRNWAVEHGYDDLAGVGQGVGDNYPVTNVNWYDVVKWCNARSEKEGKTPVYKNGTDVYRTGIVIDPQVVPPANGYRLPSEKEWEFAARGGRQTKGYTYSGSNNLDEVGWYFGNSGRAVKEVGKKQANELGIYDMSGNVLEWSGSWYPGYEGSYRVVRGGSAHYSLAGDIADCAVGFLNGDYPLGYNYEINSYGFRVVLSSVP